MGVGILVSSASLKNILLIIGAATIVVESGLGLVQQISIWAVFTALTAIGIISPVLIRLVWQDHAATILDQLYVWMEKHSGGLIALLTLIMGLLLLHEALEILTSI